MFTFPIFSVSSAHANDFIEGDEFVNLAGITSIFGGDLIKIGDERMKVVSINGVIGDLYINLCTICFKVEF